MSFSAAPVIGSGEFVFECHHNWGHDSLPVGHDYGNASHGIAFDSQGLIYISHNGNPGSIFVFDGDGRFVKSMGELHNAGPFAKGHGVTIRRDGSEEFLYLAPADSAMGFTRMTLSGEVVWQKNRATINQDCGGLYDDPAAIFRPTKISFRPDGGYYLGDAYGSHYIFEYDCHDKYVRTLGGFGSEPGRFATPHGHWLDDRDGIPKLVVADRANQRLQWFDMNGQYLKSLGDFLFPADIDVQGEFMLVPDLHARLTILNGQNEVVAQLGDDELWRKEVLADNFAMRGQPERWRRGRFVHPHDARFDADGNIYVAEWVKTGRVTKLVRQELS